MTVALDSPSAVTAADEPEPQRAATAAHLDLRRRLAPPMPTDRVLGWIGPLGVFLVALLMRLWHLTSPKGIVFDEVYYAKDSWDLVNHGYELNKEGNGPGFVVHPPLGKWLIGLGEKWFGQPIANAPYDIAKSFTHPELGWRISAAVCGSLAVLILARTARRMFRSTVLGCFAGLLLAFDGLEFTLSRIALLDIFLMFWVVVALACLVLDRDQGRRRLADRMEAAGPSGATWPGPKLGVRWWRLACGVALGAATATKWSGLYFMVAFPLFAYAWDAGARRTAGIPSPYVAALRRDWAWLGLGYVVLPLASYTAAWTGWFLSNDAWDRHDAGRHGIWGSLVNWLHYQDGMYQFHANLHSPHPYASKPLSWLLLGRPVLFAYDSPKPGENGCPSSQVGDCAREVLAIGTPTLWWFSIAALLVVVYLWASRRDWRAALIIGSFAAGFAPWLLYPERTMFLFYAIPLVPFMVLAVTMVAGMVMGGADASEDRQLFGAIGAGMMALVVVATFVFFLPMLSNQTMTPAHRSWLVWIPSWGS